MYVLQCMLSINENNFIMNVIVVISLISKYQTIESESIIKYYARVQIKRNQLALELCDSRLLERFSTQRRC